MRFYPRGNLRDTLYGNIEIHLESRLRYMLCLANGLSFLHERGIVHRDIAARNLLLEDGGTIRIGDFVGAFSSSRS